MPPKRAAGDRDLTSKSAKKRPKLNNEPAKNDIDVEEKNASEFLKAKSLWDAVDEGKVEIARKWVRSGADLSVRKADDDRTLLHEVIMSYRIENNVGREELIRLMLDYGADVNARDSRGHTVLHYALTRQYCSTAVIELLLQHGVSVMMNLNSTILDDITIASAYRPDLLVRLIEHQVPDKQTRDQRGFIAIDSLISRHITGAKWKEVMRLIKAILDLGVPANTANPFTGQRRRGPLLSTALSEKKMDAVKLLLDYGADPNKKDERGYLPLFLATAFKSYTHVTRWLIEKGANIHACSGRCNWYPVHGARMHESLHNMHLLLNLGADLNVIDSRNATPFRSTSESKLFNLVGRLIIKHYTLQNATGRAINIDDMRLIRCHDPARKYYQECIKELEQIKETKIVNDIAYYSLLSKNMHTKSQLIKNSEFVSNFEWNDEKRNAKFPQYSYMLLDSVKIAEAQSKVMSAEIENIEEAFEGAMPYLLAKEIASYSCLEKMKRCHDDYFMSLHANLKRGDKARIK